MNVRPFRRANEQFGLIHAAMQLDPLARAAALGKVPEYKSRGKLKTVVHRVKATARVQRAARKARNVIANRKAHR